MTPRLAAGLVASAMIRRVAAAGGTGTVIHKGDEQAGAILVVCAERGRIQQLVERTLGVAGQYGWTEVGPEVSENEAPVDEYLAKRRRIDPDLWVIELDIAEAKRFAAGISP